jgi:hypothetical protein
MIPRTNATPKILPRTAPIIMPCLLEVLDWELVIPPPVKREFPGRYLTVDIQFRMIYTVVCKAFRPWTTAKITIVN